MNQLNLNSDGKGKSSSNPQTGMDEPQDAMSVAVSSLVNMAARMGQLTEILSDMQTILYDIREYQKEKGLEEGYLNEVKLSEIEKDDDDE